MITSLRYYFCIGLLVVTSLLQACGFTPLYAQNNNNPNQSLSQIEIDVIPDRSGQFLRNALIDRFHSAGYPSAPSYNLTVTPIVETINDFDITIDSEATRRQVRLTTTMRLIDTSSGRTVLDRRLVGITAYNVLESEYSTLVTEQSARESALNDLARQMEQQVILFMNRS